MKKQTMKKEGKLTNNINYNMLKQEKKISQRGFSLLRYVVTCNAFTRFTNNR